MVRLFDLLDDLYKEEYLINEGLIKTHDIPDIFGILNNTFNNIKLQKQKNNTFLFVVNNPKTLDIDKLLTLTNNLGWYPVRFNTQTTTNMRWDTDYVKKIQNSLTKLEIVFEAKYDILINNYPSLLYHVTPLQNVNKILQKGLSPKTKSKVQPHPERVYLTTSVNDAKYLSKFLVQNQLYGILQIDTQRIPNYFRLYQDPNYKNGFYTLNTIPPHSITQIYP